MVVYHFGPDPSTVGGMATAIRLLTEHKVGGDIVESYPTWKPQSPVYNIWLVASSARTLLRSPSTSVAHIHLSEGGSFVREGQLLTLAHHRGLVTVATIHGAAFMPFAHKYPRLVSSVLKHADLVTCLDDDTLAFIRRLSSSGTHCELVPNPVFVEANPLPADETTELVVFAGEIGLRKGADVLCRAWQHVSKRRPNASCLMVGPATSFVPPRAKGLEIRTSVRAVEMKEILRRARVVALPSRAEGMPMILAEAMSMGRPFVSTPVGGIPELADGGGILVPVDDEIRLADRLTDMLADPDRARLIGNRGRQFCLETRSVEIIDARLRALYQEACESRRQR
jgi:glycosyltransferase involved in cell wall biosynthesis